MKIKVDTRCTLNHRHLLLAWSNTVVQVLTSARSPFVTINFPEQLLIVVRNKFTVQNPQAIKKIRPRDIAKGASMQTVCLIRLIYILLLDIDKFKFLWTTFAYHNRKCLL